MRAHLAPRTLGVRDVGMAGIRPYPLRGRQQTVDGNVLRAGAGHGSVVLADPEGDALCTPRG